MTPGDSGEPTDCTTTTTASVPSTTEGSELASKGQTTSMK